MVIGGGITGAGIALDAASRGMKVALVEKGDFASGTSSRSTKLIHGGLRYLKQFDFWLVKEVGSERAVVHKLATHLVLPEKMLLPLIEGGTYGKILTSIGLKVYDLLAQVSGEDKRQMLTKKEALRLEPLLPAKHLKGAGYYAEYRTDDARLTIENIKTGLQYGTTALNYVEVIDFLYKDDRVAGVKVRDMINGSEVAIQSQYVINATGPWVDKVRTIDNSLNGKRLHLSKGVHLVFPHEKFPVKQSVYFDVSDGRMIFAIPRGNITYVGTTDTFYKKNKNTIETSLEDAEYLISAVNTMFPSIKLSVKDVQSSWAGLRPLIHEEGKSESELSRKDEIFTSETGLLSIAGGKLSGYRKMAERIVDLISKKMEKAYGQKLKACTTSDIAVCGNAFEKTKQVKKYVKEVFERIQLDGFTKYDARYLVTTYGIQTEAILQTYAQLNGENPGEKLARAEVQFGIHYEMVQNPLDFFIRRTGRMYFDIDSVKESMPCVLKEFQLLFAADNAQMALWEEQVHNDIKSRSEFF